MANEVKENKIESEEFERIAKKLDELEQRVDRVDEMVKYAMNCINR